MKFASATNPQIRSEEDLIVLCYEEERILLPLPRTFADAQRVAREAFRLGMQDDIVFETTDLAGCADLGPVQIREAAWPGISPVLSKLSVRARKRGSGSAASAELLSQRLSLKGDPVPKSHRLFDSLSEAPSAKPSSSSTLSRRSFGLAPHASSSSHHGSKALASDPEPLMSGMRESLHLNPSVKLSSNGPLSGGSSRHSERDELVEEEEEEEEYIPNPSPTKGVRSMRPRVLSDDEDEDEYDRVHEDEARSAEDEEEEAAVEQEVTTGPLSQESAAPDVPAEDVIIKEEPLMAGMERLSISKAATKSPDLQSLIEPLDSLEKTFLITVDYDDGDAEGPRTSTFKTKGRHTVHKVLYTVCRTFGVEEYYQQAQLVLVIEEEVGTDRFIEHKFMCTREDTMERAGARPDARFLLVIEDEEHS